MIPVTIPAGVQQGSCVPGAMIPFGAQCSYTLLSNYVVQYNSLTIQCDHFGMTTPPVMASTSCVNAPLPTGTARGRCDSSYCYLYADVGWTLSTNAMRVTCSAGQFTGTLPVMKSADFGRTEPLFAPLYNSLTAGGFNAPAGMAIDSTATYLYISDTTNNHIWRLSLAYGTLTQMDLSGTTLVTPCGIYLDELAGAIYITGSGGSNRNIFRLTLSTGIVSPGLVASGILNTPRSIVMSPDRKYLYVTDSGTNNVYQISFADYSCVQFQVGYTFNGAWGLAINAANTKLYVSDTSGPKVYSLDIVSQTVRPNR
jgi:DNA-binding beta-propeller fold protein YncE